MDTKQYPVTHSDAEWHKLLTPEQFRIMRGHGTEAAGKLRSQLRKARWYVLLRRLRSAVIRFEEEI